MENSFFSKRKIMGQTPNNFTIIKSITIILVYASWLKKKNKNLFYFSLLSQTHIFFLKGNNPFIFSLFTMGTHIFLFTVRCLFFLLVCVLPFSTPRACLFYIEFCRLTLLGTFGVLTFHVSPISSWNRSPHQLGLAH